jgi:hypothetical protein
MERKEIEAIVRNNFQKVNKEGMGFLETNIKKCIDDIDNAYQKAYRRVIREHFNDIANEK